ncbi:hypothetical protein FB451DRAFT_1392013 [Mycena latifolia]|nr:hypothetical protein FB451DRAFT_1392013 [Mycena latifolia]
MTHPPLTSKYEKPLTLYQIDGAPSAMRNRGYAWLGNEPSSRPAPSKSRKRPQSVKEGTRPSIVKGTVEVSDYGSLCGVSRAYRSPLRATHPLIHHLSLYEERYGSEACAEYEKAMLERKKTARARRKAKARAREPYHSGDERDAVANGDVADC